MMVAVEVIVDVHYNDQNDANDIDDNVDGENGDDENMSMMRLSVRMLLNSQVTLRPLTPNLPSSSVSFIHPQGRSAQPDPRLGRVKSDLTPPHSPRWPQGGDCVTVSVFVQGKLRYSFSQQYWNVALCLLSCIWWEIFREIIITRIILTD